MAAVLLAGSAISSVQAAEVVADPACCRKPKPCNSCCPPPPRTACASPCPDPCQQQCRKVGPIRRFFQRICHKDRCCPPVAVAAGPPVLIHVSPVSSPCPPAMTASPAMVAPSSAPAPFSAPPSPPASISPFPSANSSMSRTSPPPAAAPIPVRPERIASLEKTRANSSLFTLVSDGQERQVLKTSADDQRRIRANLPAGTWHVYAQGTSGDKVYRGKLNVRETGLVTLRMN
ncbi:MAG: hypothetical protein ACKO23_02625 [Gemmataceae bacterium]